MESLEKKKIKLCRKAVSSEIFDGRWQFMRFMKHEIKKRDKEGKRQQTHIQKLSKMHRKASVFQQCF